MDRLEVWDEAKLKLQFPGRIIVNTQDEHYKFWTAHMIDDHNYIIHWGRIGKATQSMTKYGNNNDIDETIRSKIKKGYREI